MHKLSFPPIRNGLQVSVAQNKEPPERSWSKYKKVLIDNPKDSYLLHRQKLWNFQKLNRGAFRSQIASLPDIPYRHTNAVEKVSVGCQVDFTQRFSRSLRVIFPNLTNRRSSFVPSESYDVDSDDATSHNKACSPMQEEENDIDRYSDDFEDDGFDLEDNDLNIDDVIRTQNAGTMTDKELTIEKQRNRKRKSVRDKSQNKKRNSILATSKDSLPSINKKKNVKFHSESDSPEVTEEAEVNDNETEVANDLDINKTKVPTLPNLGAIEQVEKESTVDELAFPVENIGHSSHLSLDNVSILDYISGNLTDRSRVSERARSRDSNNAGNISKRRSKMYSDPDADRIWFEKLVGDKELIDSENYESFARIRPQNEPQSQSDQEKLNEPPIKMTPRKNFTPRINDEFPAYHSVLSKSTAGKNSNSQNGSPVTTNKNKTPRRSTVGIGKFY